MSDTEIQPTSTGRSTTHSRTKSSGIHYTPPALASFLATATLCEADLSPESLTVLDPACGDGGLLAAVASAASPATRRKLRLVGFDTDPDAVFRARQTLMEFGVHSVSIAEGNFLEMMADSGSQLSLGRAPRLREHFDIVIANPPYVRTQVLGAKSARELARAFDLSGRVDLYHAFVMAITRALRDNGTLGLLTSNRFLVTLAGEAIRAELKTRYAIRRVVDLGDTRLFSAAVLPAIVVATKSATASVSVGFTRVYSLRDERPVGGSERAYASVLDSIDGGEDVVSVGGERFTIERGELEVAGAPSRPWTLRSRVSDHWLDVVRQHTRAEYGSLGKVRVGVKTTADAVFISDDWDALPASSHPEPRLLRPLLTHHVARRWRALPTGSRRVLYPHVIEDGRRTPIALEDYPCAARYLEGHRDRLEGRSYVTEAKRAWYELWVPHDPADWALPKLVWPDICEAPRFFLDESGAVVNGDCYWLSFAEGTTRDTMMLALAVANSTFIVKYYDTVFNNRLYAGRRRFITQYVKRFPMPDTNGPLVGEIVQRVSQLVSGTDDDVEARESILDALVWRSFGVAKEV